MASDIKQYIRLVEIVLAERPEATRKKPQWRVTLEYKVPHNPPMLLATFYVDPDDYHDDAALPLARHWMHMLCQAIGEQTDEWQLTDEAFAALKRPDAETKRRK